MADSDAPLSSPAPAPATPLLGLRRENVPITPKLEELNEARQDLFNRIQSLKQDLQGWRSKLDTQCKVYRDELSGLKTSIDTEVSELRKEFEDLRTTLQQQQDDALATLKAISLSDQDVGLVVPKKEIKEEIIEIAKPAHI